MSTPENISIKAEIDFDFDCISNYQQDSSQGSTNDATAFVFAQKHKSNNELTIENSQQQQQLQQQQPQLQSQQQQASVSSAIDESDDLKLRNLLKEFDLTILYTTLKLNDVTYRSLKYLTTEEINVAIRHLGYRSEFREKVFAWRKKKFKLNSEVGTQTIFNNRLPISTLHKSPTQSAMVAHTSPMPKTSTIFPSNMNSNTTCTNATPTAAATVVKRTQPDRIEPTGFLNRLPVVTSAAATSTNTHTVTDLEQAFNFIPTSSSSTLLKASTIITCNDAPTTSANCVTATATANAIEHQTVSTKSHSTKRPLISITTSGYLPKGQLGMLCSKVHVYNLLENTLIGRTIRQVYNKNGYLENQQRNEIVRLIIEEVMQQGESLSPKDFRAILDDIITIFPNEKAAADYYFIYRSGKGNPLGRLYQRYSNENSKRRRLTRLAEDYDCSDSERHSNLLDDDDTMSAYPQELPGNVPRIDEMTALALKQLLTTEHFSWEEVCDKWIQTWALRQKELQQSGLSELLTNWSKLSDPRAAELFKIDFRYVYPNKENMLFAKWDNFVEKITPHFDKKLNNEDIKKLYKHCKMGLASKDELDYLYAIGLTVLLPSTGRFKDQTGKLRIRANGNDSIDSFVMRLPSLESYESQLELYTRKFGPINRSIHPFLVVVSPTEYKITKIYVALENRFYCMKSFLQALDLCYKIYHTCGLKYPTICENVWTFIQRYFYDMNVPWEARSANLVALIVSLNVQN